MKTTDERTQQIYQFLIQYKANNDGIPPTVREIALATALCNEAVVAGLRALVSDRLITYHKAQTTRSIMITGGKWTLVHP